LRARFSFIVFPFLLLFVDQMPADCEDLSRQVKVLQYHLELARQPNAFIEIRRDSVLTFVKGIPVKRFPIQHSALPWGSTPKLTRVASILPPAPVRRVVVTTDQGRPSDTVSALEDIISAEHMPDTFTVTLADGALIYVTSDPALAFELMSRPVNFCVLQMERDSAQHLFWLLRRETAVIY
jgi:hypothetical protein